MGFSILLGVGGDMIVWDHPEAAWWRQAPELLLYPVQTLVCGWWLWHVRHEMTWDWNARACGLGVIFGVVGIGLWLVPYFAGWVPNEAADLSRSVYWVRVPRPHTPNTPCDLRVPPWWCRWQRSCSGADSSCAGA